MPFFVGSRDACRLACCTVVLIAGACTAFAVPAAPGSGRVGEAAACRSHTGSLITLEDIPAVRRSPEGNKAFIAPLVHTSRNIPLLTIVVGFSNMPYDDDYNWNDSFFSGEKSIMSYYSDMSFGKFTFVPAAETSAYDGAANTNKADRADDGVIHVKLSTPHYDWATQYDMLHQKANREQYLRLSTMLKSALEQADRYIDFSAYDLDGSGTIESTELAIGFVVAGYEGAYLESYDAVGKDKVLWAHASDLLELIEAYEFDMDLPRPDGVAVSSYIAVAENLEPGLPQPISTLAHELGHYLGLPDLYDTAYLPNAQWSEYTINVASVMCNAWGMDEESGVYIPYSMDPWCRYKLGWVEPDVAETTGEYALSGQTYAKNDAYNVLLIPTQKEKEYYLLENRQLTKWDAGMTVDYEGASLIGGVILWHIDDAAYETYSEYNMVNMTNHRPAIIPLFPEESKGVVGFTGKGQVYNGNPFFDKTFCIEKLNLTDAVIDLPLYGTGGLEDNRTGRWSSGIKVQFLDDSAPTMHIRVDRDNMNQLSNPDECMFCHKVHTGFFGDVVAFFHRLFYLIQNLFRR